jgi:drug/metabolite transporter (DMT)-like permease
MARGLVWPLYGLLVLIWSSTWVAIKIGLEDTPPLLGAGLRFSAAGAALLATAAAGGVGDRCPRCGVQASTWLIRPWSRRPGSCERRDATGSRAQRPG